MIESGLEHSASGRHVGLWTMLKNDKFALVSVVFLVVLIFCAVFGPWLLEQPATKLNLRLRNAPPFSLDNGWLYFLGADALGRSMIARLIVASQNTLLVAASAVAVSLVIGGTLGMLSLIHI